jgi:hypothetical protein
VLSGSAGLVAWQRRLAEMVSGTPGLEGAALPEAEQRWFEQLGGTAGFRLTQRIRQSWGVARAASVAPLTLSVVEEPRALLLAWVRSGGGTATFAEREVIPLLDFIAAHLDEQGHAYSVCRFERAVRAASQGKRRSAVRFRAAPEAVLGAALEGSPMPPTHGTHWLVIGAHIVGVWRHATAREAQRLDSVASTTRSREAALPQPVIA